MTAIKTTFYGVRGSIPAPLKPSEVQAKIALALEKAKHDPTFLRGSVEAWMKESLSFIECVTFGGNTTCVEIRAGKELIILDLGSGVREQGIKLLPEVIANKGVEGTILQSHTHHDHIQGFPFWKELFMPQRMFKNRFKLFGGKDWDKTLERVLSEQMTSPVFPVEFAEVAKTGLRMDFDTVHDGKAITLGSGADEVRILCRKLNHPQETYGYRIEYQGTVVTFATDHEPYGGSAVPRPLLELAKGADVFITDCQYTLGEYIGHGGKVQKFGWGHSYPEYIAAVAAEAKCKLVVTTHHEPETNDQGIVEIAQAVEELSGIKTMPAYEGLVLS